MVKAAPSISKPVDLSTNSDPVGSSLRTHLISELKAQTGFSNDWKHRATPAGRSWWVPVISGRRTFETVYGSSGGRIATPMATDGGSAAGGGSGATHILRTMMLATATARDHRSGKASPSTHARNSRPLNEQLDRLSIVGSAVLAAIYAWQMGFPAELLAGPCRSLAMPSAKTSSSASAAPSSGQNVTFT